MTWAMLFVGFSLGFYTGRMFEIWNCPYSKAARPPAKGAKP